MATMLKHILTLVSGLFIISCGGHGSISSENIFLGDSSINRFVLRDTSFLASFDNLPDIIEDTSIGEFIGFSNASSSEYLLLVRENGGWRNQYCYFYLTDSVPSEYVKKMKVLPDTAFIATLGAHIGISETEFCDKYKNVDFSISETTDEKIYEFQDTVNLYQSIYKFKNGSLLRMEFGYVW